jgi:hypothetical protein
MMRVHSNGGNGNLVFMQFIPEWNQLKLSFCQKINGTIYPAYLGEPSVFDLEELFTIPVSIKEEMKYDYQLILSPNPADGIVDCQLSIVNCQRIALKIFDLYGRQVRTLMDEVKSPGEYSVRLNVSDLPAGMYLVRLQAGGESVVRKLIVK